MGWSMASLAAPLTRAWRLLAIEMTKTRANRPKADALEGRDTVRGGVAGRLGLDQISTRVDESLIGGQFDGNVTRARHRDLPGELHLD